MLKNAQLHSVSVSLSGSATAASMWPIRKQNKRNSKQIQFVLITNYNKAK